MAALKVITANYMREYDRIKQFCKEHETELEAYYSFDQTEEGKKFYQKERQIFELEEKLRELFDLKTDPWNHSPVKVEISRDDLLKLSEYCENQQNKDQFKGPIPLSDKITKSFKQRECNIRDYFCKEYRGELKALFDLCKEAEQVNKELDSDKQKFIELGKNLENLYREQTKKENEEKFSCIRRSVMPACYFPILYRHFFVKDAPKYSNIEAVNKFLYRALKLHYDDDFGVFVPETLSIGLKKKVEEFENYHVNEQGEFLTFKGDRYSSLLHELMHFMNALESFESWDRSWDIGLNIYSSNIIENTGAVSEEKFSEEDIKKAIEEADGAVEEEDFDLKKLKAVLGDLYGNGVETWTMYGIFICESKQNPKKYEFYYDPINEAVADAECKIINGKQEKVVRTGHDQLDDSVSSLAIKVLNEKIGIYQFYFKNSEKLRELIHR